MKLLVVSIDSKVTKTGKPYGVLRLFASDKDYSALRAKFPEIPQEFDLYCWAWSPDKGTKVEVTNLLNLNLYNLDVKDGFVSTASTIHEADVHKVEPSILSGLGFEERYRVLRPEIVSSEEVEAKIKSALVSFMEEEYSNADKVKKYWGDTLYNWFMAKLREVVPWYAKYPAAKKNHHVYPGGLLNHTFQIMSMVVDIYPSFNKVTKCNLLYALIGAFFHDLGKLSEYTENGDYVLSNLIMLGHPFMSASKVQNDLKELVLSGAYGDEVTNNYLDEVTKITHIILSHHAVADHKDWGSPVTPHSPEALLVSSMDYLSGIGDKYNIKDDSKFYAL